MNTNNTKITPVQECAVQIPLVVLKIVILDDSYYFLIQKEEHILLGDIRTLRAVGPINLAAFLNRIVILMNRMHLF